MVTASPNLIKHCKVKRIRSSSQDSASGCHFGIGWPGNRSALTPGDSAPDNPQNTASPPLLPSSPISEKTHLSGPLFSSSPHVRHKPIKLQTVPQ